MIIKICGIKSVELAEQTASLNPDMIGFVFAKSRRQVAPEQAAEMIDAIRRVNGRVRVAGVFVNPELEELRHILAVAPLDIVQLHGDESPAYCDQIRSSFSGVDVYKVFSVAAEDDFLQHRSQLETYKHSIDGMLLDKPGGGTGQTFSWQAIPPYVDWARAAGIPLLVAGGLHPGNVGELLTAYGPDGVDVSSGVEQDGEKDIQLIRVFIERVNSIA